MRTAETGSSAGATPRSPAHRQVITRPGKCRRGVSGPARRRPGRRRAGARPSRPGSARRAPAAPARVGEREHGRPGPRDDRRDAVGAQVVDERQRVRHRRAAVAPGAGSRGSPRSRCSGWPASAATSSAVRPASAAASACGTSAGSRPRATSVETGSGGTNTTTLDPRVDGGRRRRRSRRRRGPRSRSRRRTPAPRCRGDPRSRRPAGTPRRRRAAAGRPATRPRASTTARPRSAADDEPRPRACGTTLVQASRRPGGSGAHRVERRAHRADHEVRLVAAGTASAPAPSTSTTRPDPVTSASSSSRSDSARPSESKPGPRFAEVAGTETRTGPSTKVTGAQASPAARGRGGHVGVDDVVDDLRRTPRAR